MQIIKSFQKSIFSTCALWLIHSAPVHGQQLTDPPEADSAQFLTWTYKSAPMGLYLPPASVQNPPIVMYLHYCTGNPVYSSFWIIPALNAIEPTAVFLPTAPAEVNTQYPCADWGGTYDQALRANMINALHELDSLIQVHHFDSSRVYIYGESMGGEGVYRLLMDFPYRFAGAVVASGYTENKGAKQMSYTPLWIFHGSNDELAGVSNARTIFQSIQDSGGTLVSYTEFEGLDHVTAMNRVHSEEGVLEWLLSKDRSTTKTRYSPLNRFNPSADLVSLNHGLLQFSTQVPSGSVFSLYNNAGVLLYKGTIENNSMRLPTHTSNQILHWRLNHPKHSSMGTLLSIE